ncbi:MAG: hypothetical protein IPN76_27010 [Saprospiraceae bacterium]|nr:hypothetical protein [Saprospiraceae bacterium]
MSVNSFKATWLQDGIIIADEVVMNPGTGLDDCVCTAKESDQKSAVLSNLAPYNIQTSNSNQRVVFQLEVEYSGSIRTFKIGFDRNCSTIKIFREPCNQDKNDLSIEKEPDSNATRLEIKHNGIAIATVTPRFNGTAGGLSFSNVKSGCNINFLQCNGVGCLIAHQTRVLVPPTNPIPAYQP